jgi:peptidoglycan L-alanyl-D-glutamate endopeptidase CwlK
MPKFSKASRDKLATCHPDLQTLFNEVIKGRDCTIIHGYRSPQYQFELFKKGRSFIDGRWKVVKPQHVVTYMDGYERLSKHNMKPSHAVDVMPWYGVKPHIRWDDFDGMRSFGAYVMGVMEQLIKYGDIQRPVEWGGTWRWLDYPHYQVN